MCALSYPLLHGHDAEKFLLDLYDSGAILEGDFMWRNIPSPIQIDMKQIISNPPLFKQAVDLIAIKVYRCSFDLVCGVPWAAVPFVGALGMQYDLPFIMARKSKKTLGLQKMIEGEYSSGQRVLVVEDCIGSGMSAQETIMILEEHGLIVDDIVTILDLEHGAAEKFARQEKRIHAVATLGDLIEVLRKNNRGTPEFLARVAEYRERTRYFFRSVPVKEDNGKAVI